MIKINSYEFHGYTLLVNGNDGEEQLIIVSSCGQDGTTALKVIAAQVDGGVTVPMVYLDYPKTGAATSKLIHTILSNWCAGGIAATPVEWLVQEVMINRIVEAFDRYAVGVEF